MKDITLIKSLVLTYFEGVDTKDFQKIKENFANPRNAASGSLRHWMDKISKKIK